MPQFSRRPKAPFAVALAVLACGSVAQAQETGHTPTDATVPDRHVGESGPKSLRVGAVAGLGFPQPLAIEAMAMMDGIVALGAEYGGLPTTTFGGVQTSLWALAADARLFPFRGPFFIGLRAGRQHVGASTTVTIPSVGSAVEDLAVDSWFLNPRVGFLWTSSAGLAFGMDAGAQIPLGSSVSSTLPLSLEPSAQRIADALGNSVIPTVDLLRVGLLL
jgi:hypothetical protein